MEELLELLFYPSQIIKLAVLIWTNYVIHCLTYSTNFPKCLLYVRNYWVSVAGWEHTGMTQCAHQLLTIGRKGHILCDDAGITVAPLREITAPPACFHIG